MHDASFPARCSTSGERASRDEQRARPDDGATSSSAGTVTSTRSRLRNDLIDRLLVLVRDDEHRRRPCPTPRATRLRLLRRRGLERRRRRRARASRCATWCESAPRERGAARLAVDLHVEAAHPGREGDAAARELRGADRALAGAARCPSGATAWRGRPRRARGSWRRACRARCAFSSARTVSCTRCGLSSAPNTAASSATSLAGRAAEHGCLRAAISLDLPDLDDAALRARNRALDEQQVALDVDLVDDEPELGDAPRAHVAGHLLALEHARRRRRGADRAGLADVVRAVADRAALEVVPLDRALEALADRRARDLDRVARLERLDGDGLADVELGLAAELDEVPVRRRRRPCSGGRARPS